VFLLCGFLNIYPIFKLPVKCEDEMVWQDVARGGGGEVILLSHFPPISPASLLAPVSNV